METVFNSLADILSVEHIKLLIRALSILLIGWLIARLLSGALVRVFKKHTDAQGVMLIRTFTKYLILGLAVVMAINELGFKVGVLLGAAGILTVAIGFASQTSMSNLISGLFLLGERPFMVGDTVRVGSIIGEVLSIDLLSVKLRTFDNLYARIPNEVLIKQEVINYSRFSIRRMDISIRVPLNQNLTHIREILLKVAEKNPLCLVEPTPFYMVRGFGDSWVEVLLGVWTQQSQYIPLKNSIYEEIMQAMAEQGVQFAIPQQVLHQVSEAASSEA
jgi:small-conductance mechanosensitive channel